MVCRNTQWHETAVARKRFDSLIREFLCNEAELTAVRSWCGVLREKTLFDVAMCKAETLTVLDLGTMLAEVIASSSIPSCRIYKFFKRITEFSSGKTPYLSPWKNLHLQLYFYGEIVS